MLYLFCDKNRVKLLNLKKSILGQYETSVFEKTYQTDILVNGRIENIDFVASAIKEALTAAGQALDKEVFLILPTESFSFLRIEVPADIAPSAVSSFIKDKARANAEINLDEAFYDYFVTESEKEKLINFFAIENAVFTKFKEALHLIELKIAGVLPETLAYFKLFEKTLRKEKREYIYYVIYENNALSGFLFDSYGLLSVERWRAALDEKNSLEEVLKKQVEELEAKGKKLNRLILAGTQSESVRQDTFTKSVGVWTNPLKRIIGNFYQDYIKLLISSSKQPFPILNFDTCFGSFIFSTENKHFSFFRSGIKSHSAKSFSLPKPTLPKKEVLIFILSFALSFGFFLLLSHFNFKAPALGNNLFVKPTPTPTPTPLPSPIPTPTLKREDLKIKVLNGSGVGGKATEIKDLLKAKGYGEILTGNADNFDYNQSELQVKKTKADAGILLKKDLKDNVTTWKETVLAEKEAADAVLIFGANFK
ncbi:LytR C-terminal domain-containing protein [Candidatus Roizmanbacteria bacterium]|nr:LytR C-terminal domain-containing protein [Candidatus Roizmanbacteria bacterium]